MYLLARRLFGSWIWAALAAGLLTLDPLHFVQSRTSMLDIFVPMFGLAMLLFLLYDRDRSPPGGILRPWRMAAGLAGGLALATKWTGGFFLALAIVLTFAWGVAARRSEGRGGLVATIRGELPSMALWLVLLPVTVYIVSFAGQIGGSVLSWPWSDGSWGQAFVDHHRYMWNFHTTLVSTHGYQSPPWSWMLIKRPVSYFFCSGQQCSPPIGDNDYQEIFAAGSPLVWWTSILALIGVAIAWVGKRDFRRPEGLILAGVLFTYGPWLLPGADRPAVFIFYLLPTVPFMVLALVYWMQRISETWEGKAATSLFTAGAIALFFFYLPLLTKKTLPQPIWQKRIWIFDNCDKPPGPTVTSTITVTENGEKRETTSTTQDNSSLPPTGWCWI
jgi:dolichyl-phosphate-mannose--protein O-mannosyl transferase